MEISKNNITFDFENNSIGASIDAISKQIIEDCRTVLVAHNESSGYRERILLHVTKDNRPVFVMDSYKKHFLNGKRFVAGVEMLWKEVDKN
jgi:Cft2 family RNA processing exonuclease